VDNLPILRAGQEAARKQMTERVDEVILSAD
jgi:methylmalonyl-CoA mutase cobalamin-binding subunit